MSDLRIEITLYRGDQKIASIVQDALTYQITHAFPTPIVALSNSGNPGYFLDGIKYQGLFRPIKNETPST